jgi:hypothetical protein
MSPQPQRCIECILSAAFPRIEFDERGVCNFCRNTLLYTSEEGAIDEARTRILGLIAEKKGKAEYDAVMCYSGGKDSTYTLMRAVEHYGLRVLSFTMDNGYVSNAAFENIRRVTDRLGVDQVVFKPSIMHMNAIIKASALNPIYNEKTLTRISSVCNSCIAIVNNTALKIALEKKIPFILAGFTLGQIPVNGILYKNNYEFLEESREAPLARLRDKAGVFIDTYLTIPSHLRGPAADYPHTLNLLCLENIVEPAIIAAITGVGWVAPRDVDGCSSNCRLNGFNNMIHEKTLGYNPYELELSRLIRKGLLTRKEALEKIADQPANLQNEVMNTLGITGEDITGLSGMYRGAP